MSCWWNKSCAKTVGARRRAMERERAVDKDYDVIVVGGGGAGLAAAYMAVENGARVLIAEAGETLGGSTNLSGGHVYAAGTSVQRAKGVHGDTPEDAFRYYMTLNQFKLPPSPVRRLCDEAPQVVEWLLSLGVEFRTENLHPGGVDPVPREHTPTGAGAAIVAALDAALNGKVDVALRTRVRALLIEDGAVVGIRSDGEDIRSNAVVISTGGFGANPELLARHYPDAAVHGDWTWYIGAQHSQGDHLELGAAAGADITGFNRGLLLATPGFRKELEVGAPSWVVFVNREGRRFVDETLSYNCMAGVIKEQTGGECLAIFDEPARANAHPDPAVAAAVRSGHMTTSWTPEALNEFVQARKILTADTLEGLARVAGIRWPALQTTIDTYNADCEAGHDSRFGKSASVWRPVRTGPFYAARIRPAIVCFTSTGLRIDEEARVRDTSDRPIPGLFAAGESSAGVLGDRIFGGGSSMANVLSFGRIAGRNAARVGQTNFA
jgi:fumarate reductase flavoprotein subunit